MTLAEQLSCVEREIERQEFWHEKSSRVSKYAEQNIACMRAVAETLRGLIDEVNMNEERLP